MSRDSAKGGRPAPEQPADDPVAAAILAALQGRDSARPLLPRDVALAIARSRARPGDPPDLWRRYLPAVRQQALHLARQGRIVMLRKGRPVDPHRPVKGLVRLALPEDRARPS